MSTPAAGIPSGEGQPQPGNPQPTGQPQGQPTPASPSPNPANQPEPTNASPDNPQFAEIQQRLAKAEDDARKATESAKFYQGNYDRAQQQLKAVVGAQPQADPLAEDIKFWVTRGYPEKEARDMVEFTASKMQPLISQNQALQQTVQASSRTNDALNYAMQDKDYAPLFQDQEIAMQVQQELQRCAMQGQGNMVTPEYAKAYAEQIWSSKNKPWLQPAGAAPQAQPTQSRAFLGFNGNMQPGYTPVGQQQQKASDPQVDALAQKMAQHMGHKL